MTRHVLKKDGSKEEYKPDKIKKTCKRAGVSDSACDKIVSEVDSKYHKNMTTKEIYNIVRKSIEEYQDPHVAYKYDMKQGLSRLKPKESEFERYIAKFLDSIGHKAKWKVPKINGAGIDHEVDVLLTQENIIVECKHHYSYKRFTGLDVVLEVRARLEDIQEGHDKGVKNSRDIQNFWIVTNTKFSQHAHRYAEYRGIRLLGWSCRDMCLQDMIQDSKVYPITILPLNEDEHHKFSKNDILTTKEFIDMFSNNNKEIKKLNIKNKRLDELYKIAKKL